MINVTNLSDPNVIKMTRAKFYFSENIDEELDNDDEFPKIIEESPNTRWSKLNTEINAQKLIDFDSAHLAIDNDNGSEVAWNEMRYHKNKPVLNRFSDQLTLELISEKLKPILNFLIKLDHPNLLKFYDYWHTENDEESKLVVITGYSSAGSLKKLLDSSKATQTRIKEHTYKRWLNQIIYTIKSLHDNKISIFQGHLNSEIIFIQNCGVIRLSPTLLSLHGLCEMSNQLITCSAVNKPNINLNNDIVKKDLQAFGRLAIDIFTSHLKLTPSSPQKITHRVSIQFDMLNQMFDDVHEKQLYDEYICLKDYLDDKQQRDFVFKCFTGESNIDTVWYHPFINSIHSLKVLSVFSILAYFQNDKPRKLSTNNTLIEKSSSNSSLTKSSSLNQFKFNNFSDKRKVSLTFLTQCNNLKIPQDFFGILEDIRSGLYPRLFKNKENLNTSSSSYKLRSISSSSCIDFVIQQKQILDRRSSFILNQERKSSISSLTRIDSHEDVQNDDMFLKEDLGLSKYPIENRRVLKEDCTIRILDKEDKIEINLDLKFDDNLSRNLTSIFPISFLNYLKLDLESDFNNNNNGSKLKVFMLDASPEIDYFISIDNENTFESKLENISTHLANELIDQGLLNPNDHCLIADLFLRTIKQFVVQ